MQAIDLGLSVLWGDRNLGAARIGQSGNTYTWSDAMKLRNGLDIAGQILGKGWRLPTYEEVEELFSNKHVPDFSLYGFGVVVYGRNGNTIFLPALELQYRGQYWSSTLEEGKPGCASQFRFDRSGSWGGYNKIDVRQSIRPVFDPKL